MLLKAFRAQLSNMLVSLIPMSRFVGCAAGLPAADEEMACVLQHDNDQDTAVGMTILCIPK
jgi:hypothetical protein